MTILIIVFTVLAVATCIFGVSHYLRGQTWTGAAMILAGLAMSFVPFVIIVEVTR